MYIQFSRAQEERTDSLEDLATLVPRESEDTQEREVCQETHSRVPQVHQVL